MVAISSCASTGFGKVCLIARNHRFHPVLGPRKSSERDGRYIAAAGRTQVSYLANKLITILFRHPDVADDHIRRLAFQNFQCFRGAGRAQHFGFGPCQHFMDKPA